MESIDSTSPPQRAATSTASAVLPDAVGPVTTQGIGGVARTSVTECTDRAKITPAALRPLRGADTLRRPSFRMIAFISDIHSNTEALSACLREIDRLRVERVICLGDVIGYGPEPRETLTAVMERAEFSLLGNHEHGAMFYASDFNPRARAAIDWTRDQLNRRDLPREENMKLWNW